MQIQQSYDFEETKLMLTTILSELSFLGKKINDYKNHTIKGATSVRQFTKELSSVYPHLRRVADVQQDIYANSIALWTAEQKELEEQIFAWKNDVTEAMEMLNILEILERYLPENGGNSSEYLTMRADVEKRMQKIESMKEKNVENILSKFLAIQNEYFSSALRLSNGLVGCKSQGISGFEQATLKESIQSWKVDLPPSRYVEPGIDFEIARSDSERTISSIISSPSFDNRMELEKVEKIHTRHNYQAGNEKNFENVKKKLSTEMLNFLNGFDDPKDVNMNINSKQNNNNIKKNNINFKIPVQQRQQRPGVDLLLLEGENYEDILSITFHPNPALHPGVMLKNCFFKLNTPVIGDALSVDICTHSDLQFISKLPITIAEGNAKSSPFDIHVSENASSRICEIELILSGNDVKNLKIFQSKLVVTIYEPKSEKVDSRKENNHEKKAAASVPHEDIFDVMSNLEPTVIQNQNNNKKDLMDDFFGPKPRQQKQLPKIINQPNLMDPCFGLHGQISSQHPQSQIFSEILAQESNDFLANSKEQKEVNQQQNPSDDFEDFLNFASSNVTESKKVKVKPPRMNAPKIIDEEGVPDLLNIKKNRRPMNTKIESKQKEVAGVESPTSHMAPPKNHSVKKEEEEGIPDLLNLNQKHDPARILEPWEENANQPKKPLPKYETKQIASHGEGFREIDISVMFRQFCITNDSKYIDSLGFRQLWVNLCIRGSWEEGFATISDGGKAHEHDTCAFIHRTMRAQAEDDVESEVNEWEYVAKPERKPLVTLMNNMKNVLTYDTGDWKAPDLISLMNPKKVRRVYLKTLRIVHPDRTKNLIYVDRARAERVYRALTAEFEDYKQKHNL